MPEPNEYKHLRAWGKMMGSFSYYIKAQQERAAQDNAPIDAIYHKTEGGWTCFSEIQNEHTKAEIETILARMR